MRSQKARLQELFNQKKLVIGVLLGGFSSEREISIKTGLAVAKALESLGYPIKIIDITKPSIQELDAVRIDIAFIALHGKFGEDGEVQALLEEKGIIYTGSSVEASRRAMDKFASKKAFIKAGIPTPPYYTINQSQTLTPLEAYSPIRVRDTTPLTGFAEIIDKLNYPVVIKPRSQGSSVGVSIVKKVDELNSALEQAFKYQSDPSACPSLPCRQASGRRADEAGVLVEKFIPGREVTVGILGEEPLPIIELSPKQEFYNYHAKYQDERTEYIVNPDLPSGISQKMQQIGLAAHQALGCRGFSRVDMIYSDEGRPFVLEVNSIPGLTERSLVPKAARAVGIEFPQLCERIVELALI